MKPLRFLVDVDEVLTPLVQELDFALCALAGPDWRAQIPEGEWDMFSCLPPEKWKLVEAHMARPGFVGGLPVGEGSQQALARIGKACEVFAVTSPSLLPHWAYERTLWLKEHFNLPKHQVVLTEAKYLVQGDFFLDDRPENVVAWAAENSGKAMLWTTPSNKNIPGYGQYRVYSWAEVTSIVESKAT